MVFDALILLPVVVFLLWLYGYSRPIESGFRERALDRLIALLAVLGCALMLVVLHLSMPASVEGLSRNIIAVVSSYLYLIGVLGLGWIFRFKRVRRRVIRRPALESTDQSSSRLSSTSQR